MTNNKFFRTVGWFALAGAIFFLAAFLSFPLGLGMLGGLFEILSFLAIGVVFYSLYLAHSHEAKGLSLAGLVLAVAAILVAIVVLVTNLPALANLWYLLLGLPFVIFGVLAYRNDRMPRGLAIVELLAGALFLVAGVGGFFSGPDFADSVSLFAELLMLVWLFWTWRVFWSKKFSAP
jgi:hypothetical protein